MAPWIYPDSPWTCGFGFPWWGPGYWRYRAWWSLVDLLGALVMFVVLWATITQLPAVFTPGR